MRVRSGGGLVLVLGVLAAGAAGAGPRPCLPAPLVEAPPPLDGVGGREAAVGRCPEGQVPAAVARQGPKGRPGAVAPPAPPGPPAPLRYYYADTFQRGPVSGAVVSMSQHRPRLGEADYHSLAELAVTSEDGQQVVEVGWTVDRQVNEGDEGPHLFVFHWVDGVPACYNGCGWVQVSGSRTPGMALEQTQVPQAYGLVSFQGAWWVWYQSEWIGFFPQSLWSSPEFSAGGLVQWFGEVASLPIPHSEMGSGLGPDEPGAAVMRELGVLPLEGAPVDGGAPRGLDPAALDGFATRAAYYDVRLQGPAAFAYGGPGWVAVDGGVVDAGAADAGGVDAGVGPVPGGPGCGCGEAPGGGWVLALGLWVMTAWRRTGRHREGVGEKVR